MVVRKHDCRPFSTDEYVQSVILMTWEYVQAWKRERMGSEPNFSFIDIFIYLFLYIKNALLFWVPDNERDHDL